MIRARAEDGTPWQSTRCDARMQPLPLPFLRTWERHATSKSATRDACLQVRCCLARVLVVGRAPSAELVGVVGWLGGTHMSSRGMLDAAETRDSRSPKAERADPRGGGRSVGCPGGVAPR